MRVIEFYDGWEDEEAGAYAIVRAIRNMNSTIDKELPWDERDAIFEKENRCQVGYGPNSGKAKFLVFKDTDWAWFVLKWSSDETNR